MHNKCVSVKALVYKLPFAKQMLIWNVGCVITEVAHYNVHKMTRVKCQLSKKRDELTDIDWSSGFRNRMFW